MASVTLSNVEKVYADGTAAVHDLSLQIGDGELVVLVGPSGCGKTTALRMIAGLEAITGGTIALGDEVINDVEPGERDIAMVFQSYALYPHMSVRDNVAFPLKLAGMGKAEREERVRRVARTVGLDEHLDRKPRQLSGGQRQRVAMARAIVREPQVFLMDEPLSNLDAKLRVQMRAGIAELQRHLGVTTVYVTHDQVEAMTLGDRVAVMRGGLLQQCAPPEEIYERPANLFVASFTGAPPMNLLTGTVEADGAAVRVGASRIALTEEERPRAAAGREVIVGVRPERLLEDGPDDRRLAGVVAVREALGSDVLVHVRLDGARPLGPEVWRHVDDDRRDEEDGGPAPAGLTVISRLAPQTQLRVDDAAHLVAELGALHFFDPDTGEVI